MKRSILLISPFFYPEQVSTGRYNTYLVKALVEHGYRVEVIASHPLYPEWRPNFSSDHLQGCEIFRGGGTISYPKSIYLRRFWLEVWFLMFVLKTLVKTQLKRDLVIMIFPPIFFGLIPSFFYRSAHIVGVVHDLQGVLAKKSNSIIRVLIAKILQYFESSVFKRCDNLVCVSKSMQIELIRNYKIPKEKTFVNYPFSTVTGNSIDDLIDILRPEFKHIVYSGALGEKQNPEFLIEIYKSILEIDGSVVCHVFSSGPQFYKLKESFGEFNVSRLRFHDLVPNNNLAELYKRSTVQIIPQVEGSGSGAFPSKLVNILALNTPVFAICDSRSELASILLKYRCGDFSDSHDAKCVALSLIGYLKRVSNQNYLSKHSAAADFIERECSVESLISYINVNFFSKSNPAAVKPTVI